MIIHCFDQTLNYKRHLIMGRTNKYIFSVRSLTHSKRIFIDIYEVMRGTGMHAQSMHSSSQAIAAINAICLIRQFYYTAVTFITNLSFCMIRLEKCLKMTYLSWIHTAEYCILYTWKIISLQLGEKRKQQHHQNWIECCIQIGNVKCCSNKNK